MKRVVAVTLLVVLLSGLIVAVTPSPALACHATTEDPTVAWVCGVVHDAPDPKEVIAYYYNAVGETANAVWRYVYCTLWPSQCQ